MTVKVLVVDDSGFFRRRIVEILTSDPEIEVIGTAANGREAVQQALALQPDVITMDIEMPVMDGIAAVREIMAKQPMPVLMFSSLTFDGAKATLDALDAGAADFLPKRFEDIAQDHNEAKQVLCRRVRMLGRRRLPVAQRGAAGVTSVTPSAVERPVLRRTDDGVASAGMGTRASRTERIPRAADLRAVLIGTSTGGPVALQKVLSVLPAQFPLPLVLVQHMPASFTPAFAQRLDAQTAVRVREAKTGDALEPGLALLAPGGQQMLLDGRGSRVAIRIADSEANQHYRPSVDVTFQSAVAALGGKVLAIVMTGMGADGREGVRALKARDAVVWTQDEASCVVYGMPAAVAEAGLSDRVLPLDQIGMYLAKVT